MSLKCVDSHAHIFKTKGNLVQGARYQPTTDALLEDYIAHLDQYSFHYGILIQPSFLGTNNDQMIAAIQRYPDRIRAVAVVPIDISDEKMRDYSQAGIVGARLNLFGQEVPDLTQVEWQSFLKLLEKHQWQIELHAPPAYLKVLLPKLAEFKIAVVIDHFGRVDLDKGLEDPDYLSVLKQLNPEQHWIKVSGYYRLAHTVAEGKRRAKQALSQLLDLGFENRLVWGSDWPHTQHTETVSYESAYTFMQDLLADTQLQEKVLSQNALRLFALA